LALPEPQITNLKRRRFAPNVATDNANGRVVKMRKAVHETVVAFLKQVIADECRCHFQQKKEQKKAAVCSLFC
jgi:hypothetical protein